MSEQDSPSQANVELMVQDWLDLQARLPQLKERVAAGEAELARHPLGCQYESLAEYQAALDARIAAMEPLALSRGMLEDAGEAKAALGHRLLQALPVRVWIRFGDVGVGVVYADWGMCRQYLVVQPWQAEMPRLHKYLEG